MICRRLEGEFLDYRNAVPKNNPISVTVETKELIGSIERVSVMISEKLKSPVRCVFDHDKVLLSAKTSTGEAKDICPIAGDGGGLEIGFNNRYLMEALRYAPATTVRVEYGSFSCPDSAGRGRWKILVYGSPGAFESKLNGFIPWKVLILVKKGNAYGSKGNPDPYGIY